MKRILWWSNVVSMVLLAAGIVFKIVSWKDVVFGGILGGWVLQDQFHLATQHLPNSILAKMNPHRLTDWLRDTFWPRPYNLIWGGWMEFGMIVTMTIVVGVVR